VPRSMRTSVRELQRVMSYAIRIERSANDNGTLEYSGGISIATTCWWDPDRKIPAGTYEGCSATLMSSKTNSAGAPREGVFIPNTSGFIGVFVHMGTGPSWSDGCIVIAEEDMLRLWNDISPKDGDNVTITVVDPT